MFRNSFLTLLLALFLSACGGESITSPTQEKALFKLSSAQPATSRWEVWPFNVPALCGQPTLVNGFVDVHIAGRFVINSDGSAAYREHLNSARGRIWDVLGNEYVLIQLGSAQQNYEADGSFVSVTTSKFKVVAKGNGPVQNLELWLRFSWDSVNGFQAVSSADITCRGG